MSHFMLYLVAGMDIVIPFYRCTGDLHIIAL